MSIYNSDCTRCALANIPRLQGLTVCVPGVGAVPCDIMVVGEAPGSNEEKEGIPFVGAAGKVLDACLAEAHLSRADIYTDTVVRCRPPMNRAPTKAEQKQCLYYSVRALSVVRPKVIVALGGTALKALTGRETIRDSRGKSLKLLPEYRYDAVVVATYHPASGLHNPQKAPVFKKQITDDLAFAARFARGGASGEIHIAFDETRSMDAMRRLAECAVLTVDCEWEVIKDGRKFTGPWSRENGVAPSLVALGFAGRTASGIVSVSIPIGEGLDKIERGARKLLERIPSVYHNATADLMWLIGCGFKVVLGGDTMVLASLLNIESSMSLEALSSLMTEVDPGWKQVGGHRHIVGTRPPSEDRETWTELLEYNAKDCIATLLLMEALEARVLSDNREKVHTFYRIVLLPAILALARATVHGVPIDTSMLDRSEIEVRRMIIKRVQEVGELLQITGKVEQIVFSDTSLGAIMEKAGIKLPRTEKTHAPSIKIPDLIPRKAEHPVIAPLIQLRKAEKLFNSYLRPWKAMITSQGDARLHTAYKFTEARSGRSSAEQEIGGTFQQFARGRMRRMVRARPGWKIFSADYSQIELKIAAWFANERRMIRYFNEGVDLHYAVAGWIKAMDKNIAIADYERAMVQWSKDTWKEVVSKDERQSAKAINFGQLFGGTERTLQRVALKDYGVVFTDEQALRARAGWFTLFPDMKAWHLAAETNVPYVETVFGRRRWIARDDDLREDEIVRRRINTPVQATASDLTLFAMGQVSEILFDTLGPERVEEIGFVHDNIMLHFHEDCADEVTRIATKVMEHPDLTSLGVTIPVPLEVEIKIGDTWS